MAARAPATRSKLLEATLWEAADKLRGNLEAAEYKHVVLGLVFVKYVSDAFENRRRQLADAYADAESDEYIPNPERRARILESRDEYTGQNVFWVPQQARWEYLQDRAKQPDVGQLIDGAMDLIEGENPSLKGVLPKNYGRSDIDKRLLGELVDLVGSIGFTEVDHGSDDVLGRVYEYFLGRFAAAEGRGAGEFYTPRTVVRLLVEMLQPYQGRVFDPCCGSGGMFVQSAEFVAAHGGQRSDISIYGQEFVGTTWRLAKMNLALRGIEANLGEEAADSFARDLHSDLRADFILANPPFNDSDWYRNDQDVRWQFGLPPRSNANFAWVQHFVHHLAPRGRAGFILANMALTSESSDEHAIRSKMLEDNLVDCIVTLPDRLFFSTPIPVSIWILDKSRQDSERTDVLLIDASRLGRNLSRTHKELAPEDLEAVSARYLAWSTQEGYEDEFGYCRSVPLDVIRTSGYGLLPASYVLGDGPGDNGASDFVQVLESPAVETATTALLEASMLQPEFESRLTQLRNQASSLANEIDTEVVQIGDLLERSTERLGDGDEPEVLTCTESGGLILQRERFATRVATEDSKKYKVVRRGDVVYNPYLLWKGSIDQCWIVDIGITSPAYEIFKAKDGAARTLVGDLVTSAEMIRRYDGISFGTVQRRRRASPENFLALEVRIPTGKGAAELASMLELVRACQDAGRRTERNMRDLVRLIGSELR